MSNVCLNTANEYYAYCGKRLIDENFSLISDSLTTNWNQFKFVRKKPAYSVVQKYADNVKVYLNGIYITDMPYSSYMKIKKKWTIDYQALIEYLISANHCKVINCSKIISGRGKSDIVIKNFNKSDLKSILCRSRACLEYKANDESDKIDIVIRNFVGSGYELDKKDKNKLYIIY